ncbi:MAG: DinB family protein [Candidatus Promineofilum sp.]|nr:DinB family protein [Promineifilum sp.]
MDQLTRAQSDSDSPLVAILRQHLWANLRMLDACAALNEEQLSATMLGTYGPIGKTLSHIFRGEQGYLIDMTGREPGDLMRRELRPDDEFDLQALRAHALETGEAFIAIAAGLKPGDISNQINTDEGMRWPVPTALLLAQALNHATEHRAHIMTIMAHLGIEPPDVTGWGYIEEVVPGIPLE